MSAQYDSIKEREEKFLCRTYNRYPLAIKEARGSRMWDYDGKEYVDLLAGIAVTSLGHCHPEISEYLAAQAQKLVHLSNLFYQDEQLILAEKLLETNHLDKAFFCNSGAEANEAAIKLARRYMQKVQGRKGSTVITLSHAFHGRTLATVAATGQAKFQDGFAPIPTGFCTVPWGDIDALRVAINDETAAVLVEMIQGEGGIRPMPQSYATAIQALCREKGILFMVDEVQAGMCRTGKFWAFQHYGLTPDIVTSAKALANGLPMGAMMTSNEVSKGFVAGSHATTFGAGALVSSVAAKVIDIMVRDNLAERAATLGEHLMARVRDIAEKVPNSIADVRGKGLMIGIELTFAGKDIWEKLIERGFVMNLTQERVLRLLPALTIDEKDLNAFADTLEELLRDAKKE